MTKSPLPIINLKKPIIEALIEEADNGITFLLSDEAFIHICNGYNVTEEEAMDIMANYKEKGKFFRMDYEGWIFIKNQYGGKLL